MALAVIASPAATANERATVARDARVGGDKNRTRFVADLSETVEFRAFLLADPYRVIIDLPEVQFQMPGGVGEEGRGLVSAFRYGLFAPGKSRIVIDVTGPVLINKAFVRAAENGQPARLVVDIVQTTQSIFDEQQQRQSVLRSMSPNGFATSTEAMDYGANAGAARNAANAGKPLVILDPGHGGVDPGAISVGGKYEKDIVFAFCRILKAKLEATGNFAC
jgi:N-acetylmuramoyl-L-alanine amidase